VSIAIRNAQLFEEIQRSTTELQMLLQRDTREQWQRMIQSQQRAGYYYDGATFMPLEKPAEKDDAVVLIPVTVRGQVIGKLGIRPPAGRHLKPDEMDVIKAIVERLAISAENARLLEDSQKRAVKERTIGKISERIGATANLDNVFYALMEELGQVLPESEILIQFDQDNG
jgi:GAF domain-containing protein